MSLDSRGSKIPTSWEQKGELSRCCHSIHSEPECCFLHQSVQPHRASDCLRKAKASSVPLIPCSRQMLVPIPSHCQAAAGFRGWKTLSDGEKSPRSYQSQAALEDCGAFTSAVQYIHTSSLTFPRTLMDLGNEIPFRRCTPHTALHQPLQTSVNKGQWLRRWLCNANAIFVVLCHCFNRSHYKDIQSLAFSCCTFLTLSIFEFGIIAARSLSPLKE